MTSSVELYQTDSAMSSLFVHFFVVCDFSAIRRVTTHFQYRGCTEWTLLFDIKPLQFLVSYGRGVQPLPGENAAWKILLVSLRLP